METLAGAKKSDPGAFKVARTGPTTADLEVFFETSGSAANGVDYETIATSVIIPAGKAFAIVPVVVKDDVIGEVTEIVHVAVKTSANYVVGVKTGSAEVKIIDNEPVISIKASDAKAFEIPPGLVPNPASFLITRTGLLSAEVTISIALTGMATNGIDYQTIPTTVTIPAGKSTAVVTVNVIDDGLIESDETVIAAVIPGSAYTLTPVATARAATAVIGDNDWLTMPPATITVTASESEASEEGPRDGQFTLVRTGEIGRELVVNLSLGGTAGPGKDYKTITKTVTFASGYSLAEVTVDVIDDQIKEEDETVTLKILPGKYYVAGDPLEAMVTIEDNEPEIWIAAFQNFAMENEGEVNRSGYFRVSRDRSGGDLEVPLTVKGTANLGESADYKLRYYESTMFGTVPVEMSVNTPVVIPDGRFYTDIYFEAMNDDVAEQKETIIVSIVADKSYEIRSGQGTATSYILDNEPIMTVSAADPLDEDTPEVMQPFFIRGWSNADYLPQGGYPVETYPDMRPVVVNFTLSGTAKIGEDYTLSVNGMPLAGQSVTLPSGAGEVRVDVTAIDDDKKELQETIVVTLLGSTHYHLKDEDQDLDRPKATMYLIDNDKKPNFEGVWTGSYNFSQGVEVRDSIVTFTGSGKITIQLFQSVVGVSGFATSITGINDGKFTGVILGTNGDPIDVVYKLKYDSTFPPGVSGQDFGAMVADIPLLGQFNITVTRTDIIGGGSQTFMDMVSVKWQAVLIGENELQGTFTEGATGGFVLGSV